MIPVRFLEMIISNLCQGRASRAVDWTKSAAYFNHGNALPVFVSLVKLKRSMPTSPPKAMGRCAGEPT